MESQGVAMLRNLTTTTSGRGIRHVGVGYDAHRPDSSREAKLWSTAIGEEVDRGTVMWLMVVPGHVDNKWRPWQCPGSSLDTEEGVLVKRRVQTAATARGAMQTWT